MNFSIHPSFMWSLFISALEVLSCNLQRHLKVGNNTAGHKKYSVGLLTSFYYCVEYFRIVHYLQHIVQNSSFNLIINCQPSGHIRGQSTHCISWISYQVRKEWIKELCLIASCDGGGAHDLHSSVKQLHLLESLTLCCADTRLTVSPPHPPPHPCCS